MASASLNYSTPAGRDTTKVRTASVRNTFLPAYSRNHAFRCAAFGRAVVFCLIGFIYGYGQSGFGQVCLDLTNEPAVNQSFGRAGAGVSLAGRTTYQSSAELCPLDGSYSVADAVDASCFFYLWHGVPEDHTPNDVRGNMMIVNGSDAAGAFYEHPLAGLCSGTTYEFSVWGMNLLKPGICTAPLIPDLTIRIETTDGRVIETIPLGTIPQSATPTWTRYAALFTAPEKTDGVVVKLINLQGSGGCGNDLALDDIQLKQCGACSPSPLYVPDAFSPNNDGKNDELAVFLRKSDSFRLLVYNRWGSPVFSTNVQDRKWDGNSDGIPCPAGSYSWVVTYQLTDDTNVTREYVKTGRVLLLR